MSYQKEIVNKEMDVIEKNQMEILEKKTTVTKIKDLLQEVTVALNLQKKEIPNLKTKIIQSENKDEK